MASVWIFGPFELDVAGGRLQRDGKELPLPPKPFSVLRMLVERSDRVVAREEILEAVWPGVAVSDSAFESVLRDLRRALDDSGAAEPFVATVRGRGLRLSVQATRLDEPESDAPGDTWATAAARLERALQAIHLLESARGEEAEPARAELIVALARARWAAGSTEEARELFRRVLRLGREAADPEIVARAALGLVGRTDANLGERGEPAEWLEEALAGLPPERAPALRSEVCARLGTELAFTLEHDRALALTEEALTTAEGFGDASDVAYALNAAHYVRQGPDGVPAERLASMDRAIALLADRAPSDVHVSSLQQRCIDLLELGRGDAWRDACARFSESAASFEQPFFLWLARQYEGLAALLDGELDRAEAIADEAVALGRSIGTPNALGTYAGQLFSIRRAQGRLAELAPMLEAAAERLPHLPIVRAALPAVWLATGDEGRAHQAFSEFVEETLPNLPRDPLWIATFATLAPSAAALGEPEWIDRCARALRPFAGRLVVVGFGTATHGAVDHWLGLLAAAAGRPEEAEERFGAALALHARALAPVWEAETERARQAARSESRTNP